MNRIYRVVRNSATGECKIASELASARGKRNRLSRAVASTLFLAAPLLGVAATASAAPLVELTGSNGWLSYTPPCDRITVPSTCPTETRGVQADFSGPFGDFSGNSALLVGANLSNSNSGPAVNGNLFITGGSAGISSSLYVGYENNAAGTVAISGEFSNWNSAGIMSVGNYGNGGMTIADGGNAQAFNIFVGSGETGVGDILVSGVAANGIRSGLLSAGSLYVGDNNDSVGGQPVNAGQGVLTVADGGVVTASQVYIGGRGGTGTVTVQGVNARGQEAQLNAEDVVVGMDSKGTLNIIDGGSVTDRSTIVGYDYG